MRGKTRILFYPHTHTWYNSGGGDEYIQGEETDHFFVGNRQKLGFCGEGSEALSSHVLIRFRWSRSKKRKGTRDTPTCFTFYFTNVLWGIVFVAWDTFPFSFFLSFPRNPKNRTPFLTGERATDSGKSSFEEEGREEGGHKKVIEFETANSTCHSKIGGAGCWLWKSGEG